MGNADDAQAAIQRAEMTWADVRSDELDELGGICTFSRARQLYYSADAYAWLPGHSEIAENYSTAAVDAYADPSGSDWAFGDQAGAYASLAIARLGHGEIDGANEAIGPILALAPDRRINGVVHSALRVHDALRRPETPNSTGVAATREAIEAFARTPIAAIRG